MNKSQSQIQVRIDSKTKKEASNTLSELGLDLSSAIKLFLRSVIVTQSIPFDIRTKNGFTRAQERKILKETEMAIKHGKRYSSAKELHASIFTDEE
ncbi:MAG: type II toxin-antitoxin system antitoxin, RelB/DinJ family [Candidatus Harrisonbacteria bacterium CG10_big_fil_rev_8_21_14_0_10_49_15]|uniref:Type II toxin-antitoxin system antitoxin, RelB/DinJ family n=1 Tax=Candidatus Harrisonbacteria bacterium CG10_big_fil_rev_8_21_14_0_10_49_15 TaxID=1974587 RepID=A0A2H0UKK6_9BACT|nr:MAG: type II toxin-antitoxin system antitoxin, RelB/DinJ family [Candidatus Harrisonbacteria bacterium CG10_big_fil_rev_8_21_14_0_10_49_15]